MIRGRKTETYILQEKGKPRWTTNCSAAARNLRKTDLAGVIFGCRHSTMKECYSEQLFGLPAPHISYARNITPGLPLFLFNYSDRKLHGIFEAASPGKLNINPTAWTADGSPTPYAAQVRIQIRMRCQPLLEDQFGPIIASNYYEPKLFWFELDQDQTNKLISMFSSLGESVGKHSFNTHVSYRNEANTKCCSSWDAPGMGGEIQRSEMVFDNQTAEKNEVEVGLMKTNSGSSFAAVARGVHNAPQKKWSSLFNESTTSDAWKEIKDITTASYAGKQIKDITTTSDAGKEIKDIITTLSQKLNLSSYDQSETEWDCNCFGPCLDEQVSHPSGAPTDEDGKEMIHQEDIHFKSNGECTSLSVMPKEKISDDDDWEDRVDRITSDSNCSPKAAIALEMESPAVQSIVAKLVEEVKELKSSHLKQVQKISSLESDLVESRLEVQALKNMLNPLEFGSLPETWHDDQEELDPTNKPARNLEESIVIVGGSDGSTWLSANRYHLSRDVLESLSPMNLVRSYASAAKFNGQIYVFGGGDGKMWYDTVESYDPVRNQWSRCPPLTQRKGSLAGVSYNDKIFAIGGGNGFECLSDVEMFDLNVGRWIPTRSMLHKRFAPAAAEINGAVYVAGGFDGQDYVKSVERFDPREHSWRRLGSMSTERGCHSLAVLNEKLYAIGGFDGNRIASTVEVYDPRSSSWMTGESMKECRGYSGAVVIGDSIYMIGGLTDGDQISDTVECYKEGVGWQLTDLKAIGKRCFFSAVVF
ncbi:hypothetical protein FNV43_RR24428 [Rhamnella rubrinervis]|uniref:DCD domain-containing protein n=1 Tax=Rhamnella rubrinervis TaxID=2594499 RepID=A0A8K0DMR8_9ROSA|nr:hypothetical protein FNV43_RR24428 [Rhamnella rubrinervis]